MSPTTPMPLLRFSRDVSFLYARARSHWREGRYLEALQLLRIALGREPTNARLQLATARVLSMLGAYDLSRREAIRLLASGNYLEDAFFLMGANTLAQGELEAAYALLMYYARHYARGKHIDTVEDLLGQLESGSLKRPSRQERARSRVLSSIASGKLTYAGRLLDRLLRRQPQDPGLLALRSIWNWAKEDARASLRDAKQAYLLDPDGLYALCAMALSLSMQGLSPLAPQYLKRAALACSSLEDSLLLVAVSGKLGAHALCYQLLDALHRAQPEHIFVLRLLILACYNTGDLSQAARLNTRYALMDPEDLVSRSLDHRIAELLKQQELPVLALPYRWALPPGDGTFLLELLPHLRSTLPLAEELLTRHQGFAPLLR